MNRCSAPLNASADLSVFTARTSLGPLQFVGRDSGMRPPLTDIVTHKMKKTGYWEISDADEVRWLTNAAEWPKSLNLRRDSGRRGLFIDLAAHVGWYSFLFAQANYSVLAIEPLAANRRAIAATSCLNPELASRITLVPKAISDQTRAQPCEVWTGKGADGNGVLDCDNAAAQPCARKCKSATQCVCEAVSLTTLDRVLTRHVPLRDAYDLIIAKFDMEGSECAALRGGQSIFERLHVDLLQFEGKGKQVISCMQENAARHGYTMGDRTGHDQNRAMWPDQNRNRAKQGAGPYARRRTHRPTR